MAASSRYRVGRVVRVALPTLLVVALADRADGGPRPALRAGAQLAADAPPDLLALFAMALLALLLLWRLLRSESRLDAASRTDPLTGLPNRRGIEQGLLPMAADAARRAVRSPCS